MLVPGEETGDEAGGKEDSGNVHERHGPDELEGGG